MTTCFIGRAARTMTIAVSFLMLSYFNVSAQELQGADAAKIIPGSEMVMMDQSTGLPSFIRFDQNHQANPTAFQNWFEKYFGVKKIKSAVYGDQERDQLGYTHQRFQQTYAGYPVIGSMYIVHARNGKVESLNGRFFTHFSAVTSPSLSENTALQLAMNFVGATSYKWQIPAEENRLKMITGNPMASFYPTGKLVFAPLKGDFLKGEFRLCWEFDVYAAEPLSRQKIYVDATTGEVVFAENKIETSNATGTAITAYSGSQSIVTDAFGGSYRLRENPRGSGSGMQTYNLQQGTNYGAAVDFTDADNTWNNINPQHDEVATDAHWGTEMTYDYYESQQGRNSFDNLGSALISYVHYSSGYDNAFWDGYEMTYGDGSYFKPLTGLDVCGHEVSHGVCQYTAGLIYANEPGALNESNSDMMGNTIEAWARPSQHDWKVGEDITYGGTGLRNMANPNDFGNPDTYQGTYWDFFGQEVHNNSGVGNYWFYLLSDGGSGTNDIGNAFSVSGITITKAADIQYRALSVYEFPSTQYADARTATEQAAIDLYGACSNEAQQVINAWYAVGVGGPWSATVTADFSASPTSACSVPATVTFTNLSVNGGTYAWDFGDGSTSNAFAPTHTYNVLGTYTVSLTATSACGSDGETKTNYIDLNSSNPCTYNMPSSGSSTFSSCDGTLYDAGGPSGNYADNQTSTAVISPAGATHVTLTFTEFNYEDTWDYLYIYDGPTTGSPLIGTYTGYSLPNGGAGIMSSGGSMTIQYISDVNVNYSGFAANWVCSTSTVTGDNVCSAIPVSIGTNGPYSCSGATTESGEPAPPMGGCSTPGNWCNTTPEISNTLWFMFTAPSSGNVSVQTPGFDTQIAVYSANTCNDILTGGYTLLAANDDDPSYSSHGGVQYSSYTTVSCLTSGATYFVQLDPYDQNNTASTNLVITNLGNSPPAAFTGCPSNITQNSPSGSCGKTVSWTAPTAGTDPEGCTVTVTHNFSPGDFFPVGTTTVTYTADDGHGGTATCTFTVTVNDVTAPVISTCPGTQTQNLNSSCQITLADYTGMVVATDNCGTVTKTQSPVAGTVISGVGTTSVTVTCNDGHGNSSPCTFNVNRVDNTAPSITVCPGTQTQNLNSSCQITLADYTGMVSASDNCGSISKTQSPVAGTVISGTGTTAVTVTCSDGNGNSSPCTFNVNRVDNTAPVISGCPSNIVSNNPVVFWTAPTATDNCSSVTLTSNHNPGDTFPPGTTTVTYTATDAAGNSSLCVFTVTYNAGGGGAPVNDLCVNAINVAFSLDGFFSTLNCVSIYGTNTNATTEANEPTGCVQVDNSVWYRFVAPSCGMNSFFVEVSTDNAGTDYDTGLAVWESPNASCDFTQFQFVTCNDDDNSGGCNGNASSALSSTMNMTTLLNGGQTYYVQVEGFGGSTGNFDLTMQVNPVTPTVVAGPSPSTSLNVSWPSASVDHYDLYWRQTGNNGYASATGLAGTSYLISNLVPNTSYDVQYKGVCIPNGIEHYYSPATSLSTAISTCSSPGLPVCANVNNTSITISWASVASAQYYTVYWRKVGQLGYAIVNNGLSTSHTFNGLLQGTSYEFWVKAVCSSQNPNDNVTGPHGTCTTLGNPKFAQDDSKPADYEYSYNGVTYHDWDPADLNLDNLFSGFNQAGIDISNGTLQVTDESGNQVDATIRGLSIYPNPANSTATIDLNVAAEGEVSIRVYDVQGKLVKSIIENVSGTKLVYSLSLDDMPSGMYNVVVQTGTDIQTQKLAVVK